MHCKFQSSSYCYSTVKYNQFSIRTAPTALTIAKVVPIFNLDMQDNVSHDIDANEFSVEIFRPNAFDMVDHCILLEKASALMYMYTRCITPTV